MVLISYLYLCCELLLQSLDSCLVSHTLPSLVLDLLAKSFDIIICQLSFAIYIHQVLHLLFQYLLQFPYCRFVLLAFPSLILDFLL